MITISQIVEELVIQTPFLEEGLSRSLVNCTSLARQIKPEIEEKLMKKVETGAVVMAIKRLAKNSQSKYQFKELFKQPPELIVRSNLKEYTLVNKDQVTDKYSRLANIFKKEPSPFFTLTQGVFESAIIVSGNLAKQVEMLIDKKEIKKIIADLSAITIRLPNENVMIPGVYYYILKLLAWNLINVIDVVSTYSEFTIIFEEKDISRAFTILKKSLK
jgi:hypothetical protein